MLADMHQILLLLFQFARSCSLRKANPALSGHTPRRVVGYMQWQHLINQASRLVRPIQCMTPGGELTGCCPLHDYDIPAHLPGSKKRWNKGPRLCSVSLLGCMRSCVSASCFSISSITPRPPDTSAMLASQ